MNRPKLEDYQTKVLIGDTELKIEVDLSKFGFIRDLEKYCDELEQSNKSLSNAYDDCLVTLHFWEEEYHKYRKALDKACSKLEEINICPHMSKKEWKEWSLKDE